ncbi:hypothetical protein ACSBLW_17815 [Thioclava sp. FR2]|uniref:hypothetical protein n=1 Tax=Thioclava sp. FR2 TaxID=3445780 RepID=UPI003EB84D32
MSAVTLQQMADRVADMMEERLRIRGKDLKTKLKRGGRLLPRKVRHAGEALADAAERGKNPKLLVQVDMGKVAQDYDICVHHLSTVTQRGGFKARLIGIAATVAFGLLVVGAVWLFIQRAKGAI